MSKKKEYTNGEVTIIWELDKCFHSGNCVKGLPEVFKPKEKPWIQTENSDTKNIIATVKNCPSGALTYYMNDDKKDSSSDPTTKIDLVNDGPLLIHGTCTINKPDGSSESRDNVTAFCRCGASQNKPYCDGAHRKIGFKS